MHELIERAREYYNRWKDIECATVEDANEQHHVTLELVNELRVALERAQEQIP